MKHWTDLQIESLIIRWWSFEGLDRIASSDPKPRGTPTDKPMNVTEALHNLHSYIEFYSQSTGTRMNAEYAREAFEVVREALTDEILIEAGFDPAALAEQGRQIAEDELRKFRDNL